MLVGFVGLMSSGKGTAGEILQLEYGFNPDSFAAAVKDASAAIFGWPREMLEGNTERSRAFRETPDPYWSQVMGRPYTPREALQKMGTEAGRNVFHPDLWVHSLKRRVATSPHPRTVITDVRFPNEIEAIINIGGKVIVIERGDKPAHYDEALSVNQASDWSGKVQTLPLHPGIHYSEWAWIGHHSLRTKIKNDGSTEELEEKIVKTLGLHQTSV